jgi:thiamine-phosphate pyrophosphorylase
MAINKRVLSGIYLVVDPSVDRTILLDKVQRALKGGVGILQIWNNWPEKIEQEEKEALVESILDIAEEYEVPVLINDDWELLKTTRLAGVHFEKVPIDMEQIRSEVGRDFSTGRTCSNNLKIVMWADNYNLDYISFCAMFPSPSVDGCEIVDPDAVQEAREITDIPFFLSGGITPENIGELSKLDFEGVAVISGILQSDRPAKAASEYKQALNKKGDQ